MDEWKHPVPRNLRLAEDPPTPLWLWALAWVTLAGLLLLAVLSLSGCSRQSPAEAAFPGALQEAISARSILCEDYPAKSRGDVCSREAPSTTEEALQLLEDTAALLCSPPPEGLAQACEKYATARARYQRILDIGRDP